MNANMELLSYINESSKMCYTSMKELMKLLEDKKNAIKKELKETIITYETYTKESRKRIDNLKEKSKDLKPSVKMMAKMGVKKEVKNDNSDAAISHMIIEGLTIGIIDLESLIENYGKEADKKVLSFSKEYLNFNKKQVEIYKEYL